MNYNNLMFLCVLCLVMSICLWVFGGYHLRLIQKGITSAERIKVGKQVQQISDEFKAFYNNYQEKRTEMSEQEIEETRMFIDQNKSLMSAIEKNYGSPNFREHLREVFSN